MKFVILFTSALMVSACGTKYSLPEIDDAQIAAAKLTISEARASQAAVQALEPEQIIDMYNEVIGQVEPVSETYCRKQNFVENPKQCDFIFKIRNDLDAPPNAYQTHTTEGQPIVYFTLALMADIRNEHELAFIAGHEAGHHIGEHLRKRKQQKMAGAIALGILTGLGQAAASYNNPYRYTGNDAYEMQRAMVVGAAFGQQAYSQTYELEADMIGSFIAEEAGYDPQIGSLVFARRVDARANPKAMSLWSTHPSSPERVAIVEKTFQRIREQRAKGEVPAL